VRTWTVVSDLVGGSGFLVSGATSGFAGFGLLLRLLLLELLALPKSCS